MSAKRLEQRKRRKMMMRRVGMIGDKLIIQVEGMTKDFAHVLY